jgi:GT2 family glycosyltransferase
LQLSIIIVNYNVKYFLELCLYSVQKACEKINAEIFVVDNNSSDGSRDYLPQKFPNVNFKWNTENVGFGKANNSVLTEAKGAHILFLNPDTIVPENCFTKCLQFFKENSNCGALGVKMIDGHGVFLKESKRSFPSPSASFFKMSGMTKLFPASKLFARYYAGNLPVNKNNIVDALAGAFIMLSKAAIEKTKGFDEDFFMYGEDIDLSFRIQKAGLVNYYFADTTIIHFKGESTQKQSANYVKHFYGAMKLFVQKHYADKKWLSFFMMPAISFSGRVASIKHSFSKNDNHIQPSTNAEQVAIVATEEEFNEILSIVKHASPPVIICGRIAPAENSDREILPALHNALSFLKNNKITQVIFCEGYLSFESIILTLQYFPKKLSYLFRAAKSNTITGDGKKGSKGIFFTKD